MIQGLLLRWGLGFLAPFVLPAIVAAVIGAGGTGAWWLDILQAKDAVQWSIVLMAGFLCLLLPALWMRLVGLGFLVFLTYALGRLDEQEITERKVNDAVAAVHASYKNKTDEEVERQKKLSQDAKADAEKTKSERLTEVKDLRSELQKLRKEADDAEAKRKADPKASSDVGDYGLDVDDIALLNRVRVRPGTKGR